MKRQRKKKEGVQVDPWEDMLWVDDTPVYRPKKKGKGRGVLTNRKKMSKFFIVTGQ